MKRISASKVFEDPVAKRQLDGKKVLIYSTKWNNFWLRGDGYTNFINQAGVFYFGDALKRVQRKKGAGDFAFIVLNDFEANHWSMTK